MKPSNKMATNGQGLVLCWRYNFQPELKPKRITDDEDKYKCPIELDLFEPLLITNKTTRIYSSASIAANPMLAAVTWYHLTSLYLQIV